MSYLVVAVPLKVWYQRLTLASKKQHERDVLSSTVEVATYIPGLLLVFYRYACDAPFTRGFLVVVLYKLAASLVAPPDHHFS
jgi:hypothetical protein